MTLLLKMSSVGVNSVSMEKEDEEGVGEEGDTSDVGRSLSLEPRGSEGEGRRRVRVAKGSWECERSRTGGRGELLGEGVEGGRGLEGLCRSARLLRGLLTWFMYVTISSASSRRAEGALRPASSSAASDTSRDRGSKPTSMPVL